MAGRAVEVVRGLPPQAGQAGRRRGRSLADPAVSERIDGSSCVSTMIGPLKARSLALITVLSFTAVAAACTPAPSTAPPPSVVTSTTSKLVGTLNPPVTQATIHTTICVAGWTGRVRPPSSWTSALERRQIRELGLPGTAADYEEDHLMPLALGGAPRDPRNLRPVPRATATWHDGWETRLHREVCAGTMTLTEARTEISRVKADLR